MFSASLYSAGRQYFKTVGEGQRFLRLETHQRAKWCPKAKNDSSRILHPVFPLFLCLTGIGRLAEGLLQSPCSDVERRKRQTDLPVFAAKPWAPSVERKRNLARGGSLLPSLARLWRWEWVTKPPFYLAPWSLLIPASGSAVLLLHLCLDQGEEGIRTFHWLP